MCVSGQARFRAATVVDLRFPKYIILPVAKVPNSYVSGFMLGAEVVCHSRTLDIPSIIGCFKANCPVNACCYQGLQRKCPLLIVM